MKLIADRLSSAIKERGFSNADIVNILSKDYNINISIDTVKSYRRKNGKNINPSTQVITALSKILHVSTDYLLGVDSDIKPVRKIPIVGTASCGGPDMNHLQEIDRYCYYGGNNYNPQMYALIANGDSMSPEIDDGDEVICDPLDRNINNGDIVHYRLYNESAIKIYFKDEDANIIQLIPYNPTKEFKVKTIRLDDSEAQFLEMNKVVAINKFKNSSRARRLQMIGRI